MTGAAGHEALVRELFEEMRHGMFVRPQTFLARAEAEAAFAEARQG